MIIWLVKWPVTHENANMIHIPTVIALKLKLDQGFVLLYILLTKAHTDSLVPHFLGCVSTLTCWVTCELVWCSLFYLLHAFLLALLHICPVNWSFLSQSLFFVPWCFFELYQVYCSWLLLDLSSIIAKFWKRNHADRNWLRHKSSLVWLYMCPFSYMLMHTRPLRVMSVFRRSQCWHVRVIFMSGRVPPCLY